MRVAIKVNQCNQCGGHEAVLWRTLLIRRVAARVRGLIRDLSPLNWEVEQFRQFPITLTGNERQSREIAP